MRKSFLASLKSVLRSIKLHLYNARSKIAAPLIRRFFGSVSVAISCSFSSPLFVALARTTNGIQLTTDQLLEVSESVRGKSSCNLLVFGVGNDSLYWTRLNQHGRTVFLEDNSEWLAEISNRVSPIEAYTVCYNTHKRDWQALLDDADNLEVRLPDEISGINWDVILVDGPAGYHDNEPGRMKSIFSASQWADHGCDVFVHDCNRPTERAYTDRYFGDSLLLNEVGILRHYRVPVRSFAFEKIGQVSN